MKNFNLPQDFQCQLKNHQIPFSEIIAYAQCDFDLDFDFRKTFLFLTKSKLFFVITPKSQHQTFTGFHNKKTKSFPSQELTISEVSVFDLQDIESIYTVNHIVGGIVTLKTKDGEKALCLCSNTSMRDFGGFLSIFSKVKAGQEITDDDYKKNESQDFCPKCGTPYPERGRNICPKCMDKRSIFVRILKYFKPYKFYFLIVSLLIIANAGVNLIAPYLSGIVFYNKALGGNPDNLELLGFKTNSFFVFLTFTVLIILLSKIIQLLFGLIQGRLIAHFVPKVVANIKNDVFKSMQTLSISFFKSRQTGGLMTRVNDDANQVFGFFVDGLPYCIVNILQVVTTLIIMFALSWQLSIFAIVFMPFAFIVTYFMLPKLWHYFGKRHRSIRNLNSHLNDNITGARVVKAFGRQDTEISRFSKVNSQVREAEISLVNFDIKFKILFQIVMMLSGYVVWLIGGWLTLQPGSAMTYGTIMTFVGYVNMLAAPMDFISYIFRWGSNSLNSGQRIFEILDAKPDIVEKPNAVHLPKVSGKLEMKNVTFAYEDNKNVLTDINFEIEPGQMLGIVGHSGAGKSTIANLLTRMYDPAQGEICLDGVNIKDLAISDIRQNIGIVSQESYIFKGTIAQNIAYAKPNCTSEEIIKAAICANAHDFICKLPSGYDTIIGTGGHTLSGGERQRISIARATLSNPPILILDEATASVDTQTEQKINQAIESLAKGKTIISIAHRLSTLRGADKLIVIENGKICEQGTHLELANKKDGVYYKLLQIQNKALAMRGINQ